MIKQLLVIYQLLAGSAKKIQHSSWVRYLLNPRWLGYSCFVDYFCVFRIVFIVIIHKPQVSSTVSIETPEYSLDGSKHAVFVC